MSIGRNMSSFRNGSIDQVIQSRLMERVQDATREEAEVGVKKVPSQQELVLKALRNK